MKYLLEFQPYIALFAGALSIISMIIGVKNTMENKKESNRDLYYKPLSIRLDFSDKKQLLPCQDAGEFAGMYQVRPLELICFQGYVKTVRLFFTNLSGKFSLQTKSINLDEIEQSFVTEKPYAEPIDLTMNPIIPIYMSELTMIAVHFLLIEGFLGDSELFMVFQAFDKETREPIIQTVFDKFHLLSDEKSEMDFPTTSEKMQGVEINTILRECSLAFKELNEKLTKIRVL